MWVRNSTDPDGPVIVVPAPGWLELLDHVTAGHLDRRALTTPVQLAQLVVTGLPSGDVELSTGPRASASVRYTAAEWDAFVAGVREDGEFTLAWLLATHPAGRLGADS